MVNPEDPADHAEDFARRFADDIDLYCAQRMKSFGIPDHLIGAEERTGGHITRGITVNSGVLNPILLKGKGRRVWALSNLRDRIDAVIAHEWEEYRHDTHEAALKQAPRTALPITDGARRILRAMRKP